MQQTRIVHRRCPDCFIKTHVPEEKIPDKTWLNWNKGSTTEIAYQIKSEREKPVFLTINSHEPEKLSVIMKKKTTHLDDYLRHGVIPKVNMHVKTISEQIRSTSASHDNRQMLQNIDPDQIRRGTVEEKMFHNMKETPFNLKRNKQWVAYNWRPKTAWSKIDRQRANGKYHDEFVRQRNNANIYNQEFFDNLKQQMVREQQELEEQEKAKSERGLNQLGEVASINPSDITPPPESQMADAPAAEQKQEKATLAKKPEENEEGPIKQVKFKRSKKQREMDTLREVFSPDEIRQLYELPEQERSRILASLFGPPKRKAQKRKEDEASKENVKVIRFWDGYQHKYSPKKDNSDLYQQLDFTSQVYLPTEGPPLHHIHNSKQNGYFGIWYDATNAVHPNRVESKSPQKDEEDEREVERQMYERYTANPTARYVP